MRRLTSVLATTVLMAAGAVALSPAPATADAQQEARSYRNCDALNHDFRNGVAKGPAAARKQVRDGNGRPATSRRARAIYQENKSRLDRDNDGTACEQ